MEGVECGGACELSECHPAEFAEFGVLDGGVIA